MAWAILAAKWPRAVPQHGKTHSIYSLKFTFKMPGKRLILQDNARYESTPKRPMLWVLMRQGC